MATPVYTGTVTVTDGSTTFTGSGTAWAVAGLSTGQLVIPGKGGNVVASITSDTEGEFLVPWAGPTLIDVPYLIIPFVSITEAVRTASRQMIDIQARLDVGISLHEVNAKGTLAERDAYDEAAKGFTYAALDDAGGELVVYVKASTSSADWDGPFQWRGPSGLNGVNGKTGGAFSFEFDGSSQTMEDVADGTFRLNNATPESATALAISAALADATDVSALIAARLDGAGATKARLIITSGTNRMEFDVTGVTDNTDWLQLALANGSIAGTLSDEDACELVFSETSNTSSETVTVAGIASEIATVAGIETEVQTVAARDADIATVAARDTDIGTVATRDADIATVAGLDTEIAAVVADEADIGVVATNIADVTTAADNIAAIIAAPGAASDAEAAQTAAEAAQALAEAASLIEYSAFWFNEDESVIAEGGWPITRRATRAITVANLFAEVTHAGAGESLDVEVFVDGLSVYGPTTVTYGTPLDLDALSIDVDDGSLIGVDLKDASGAPYGFWLQMSGN